MSLTVSIARDEPLCIKASADAAADWGRNEKGYGFWGRGTMACPGGHSLEITLSVAVRPSTASAEFAHFPRSVSASGELTDDGSPVGVYAVKEGKASVAIMVPALNDELEANPDEPIELDRVVLATGTSAHIRMVVSVRMSAAADDADEPVDDAPEDEALPELVQATIDVVVLGTSHAPGAASGGSLASRPFIEQTSTAIVFAHGGVVRLTEPVTLDQILILRNAASNRESACRVVSVKASPGAKSFVELEFLQAAPGFWSTALQPSNGDSAVAAPTRPTPATTSQKALDVPKTIAPPLVTPPSVPIPQIPMKTDPSAAGRHVFTRMSEMPAAAAETIIRAENPRSTGPQLVTALPTHTDERVISPRAASEASAIVAEPVEIVADPVPASSHPAPGDAFEAAPAAVTSADNVSDVQFVADDPVVGAAVAESAADESALIAAESESLDDYLRAAATLAETPAPQSAPVAAEPAAAPIEAEPEVVPAESAPATAVQPAAVEPNISGISASIAAPETKEPPVDSNLPSSEKMFEPSPKTKSSAAAPLLSGASPFAWNKQNEPKRIREFGLTAAVILLLASGAGIYLWHQKKIDADRSSSSAPATGASSPASDSVPNPSAADATPSSIANSAASRLAGATGDAASQNPSSASMPAPNSNANQQSSAHGGLPVRPAASAPAITPPQPARGPTVVAAMQFPTPTASPRAPNQTIPNTEAPTVSANEPNGGREASSGGILSDSAGPAGPAVPRETRTSSGVIPPHLLTQPSPVYPYGARSAHVEGTVSVDLLIDQNGNVISATVVSGPPLLRDAALAAVRRCKYAPAILDGGPVASDIVVNIDFKL